MSKNQHLEEVIEMAGGPVALAARFNVNRQSIHQWVRRGWLPSARAKECREFFGDRVRVIDLIDPSTRDALSA